MLNRFAQWFASAAGTWQTLIAVAATVVLELTHVIHDNNGFWLLYWLTVYSAITQPLLAYTNKRDASKSDAALARIEAKEDSELALLTEDAPHE